MKPKLIRCASAFAAGALAALAVFMDKGLFAEQNTQRVYRVLCDGFFLAAVLLLCAGALLLVTNEGLFSMLGFSVKRIGVFFFTRKTGPELEKFSDYYHRKRENRVPFAFLLVIGGIFLVAAGICCILFMNA